MGDRDLVMTHIGSDLGGARRSRREISREIIIAVMKRKKIFSTYQEWDNETLIIIKPIMAYLFLNQIVVTSYFLTNHE